MESSTDRCQLCNGHAIQISEHEFQCIECGFINHRGK
jgi:hypothetical protein